MFNKKSLILGAASVLVASALAGCGGGKAKADLTYWCPSVDNDVMDKIVEEFKKDNPDYADKNIALDQNYGEGDTYAQLHADLGAAADVMLMADDNIRSGVKAEEIASVDEDKAGVVVSDGAEAVAAVSVEGKMYGYPYRGDNSPLPIYDATLFTAGAQDPRLGTFEGMLQACKEAGKKLYWNVTNGWYEPTLLLSGGAKFTVGKDSEGKDVIKTDVVDHKADVGAVLEALKELYKTYKDTWMIDDNNSNIEAAFKNDECGVAFLWNDLAKIRTAGGNVGVTTWPTLKVGTVAKPMYTFRSFKAVVCKEQEAGERLTLAKKFAKYCASEKAQVLRLDLEYGPSNLKAQLTEKAQKLEFVKNINIMGLAGHTWGQAPNVTGDFWTPMANLGKLIVDGKYGDEAWGAYDNAAHAAASLAEAQGWMSL